MKFVKFSIFALSLGLFVASCGDSTTEETTTETDTTVMMTPAPEPAPMDTMTAPAAGDTSMMVTTDTTTMAK